MKTKLLIIVIVATMVSACTTGTHMTRTYDDDIYFSPGDVPPVSVAATDDQDKRSNSDATNQRIVISETEKNEDGTTTQRNHIYESEKEDYQAYDMDEQDLAESDTTVYYNDDSVKYVINNYYEDDNDLDFSYRINRFHRPYYYSPFFYDDWNYGYSMSYYPGYSYGYDPWYYGGWGYPYGYYSPFAFGLGGYWGGGYYNSYYHGYYDGYYGGYYGGGYYGGGGGYYHENRDNVRYGRSTDLSNYAGGNSQRNGQVMKSGNGSRTVDGLQGNSSDQRLPSGIRSRTVNGQSSRGMDQSPSNRDPKNATIVNSRRPANSGTQVQSGTTTRSQVARPSTNTSGNVRRSYEPSTTGKTYDQGRAVRQGQNYTPSYTKPRIVNQSSYNNNTYARPRTSGGDYERGPAIKSANTSSGQQYSAPRTSSSMRQTYRSSSSYSSGSSQSSGRSSSSYGSSPSYSSPSRSYDSSPSYSSPSRSSSSGSGYSGGSSGSSSGSSGSSSGGSGGRSGSGGRR